MSDLDDNANAEVVGMVRDTAKAVLGGNCTFVDDDLARLELLAFRAVRAGLAADFPAKVRATAEAACALHRWADEPGAYPLAPIPGEPS